MVGTEVKCNRKNEGFDKFKEMVTGCVFRNIMKKEIRETGKIFKGEQLNKWFVFNLIFIFIVEMCCLLLLNKKRSIELAGGVVVRTLDSA